MPPLCIILIAAYMFCGFIIDLIISGLPNIALSYGLESVIYFNIGLLLMIYPITSGSDSIYYTIGFYIIYCIIYGLGIPPPIPPIPPKPGGMPPKPGGIPPIL